MSLMPSAGRPAAFALVLLLAFAAAPARAQFRTAPTRPAAVAVVSDAAGPGGLNLGKLFNAQTLQFSQQAEFSTTSGGYGTLGLGTYTTSVQWQPSTRLAGRVDLAVSKSLFSSGALGGAADESARLYLRNAEIAYRPTANSVLHLSIQQSPHGSYASPYGYSGYGGGYNSGYDAFGRGGYGNRSGFNASIGTSGADQLFFRDGQNR